MKLFWNAVSIFGPADRRARAVRATKPRPAPASTTGARVS